MKSKNIEKGKFIVIEGIDGVGKGTQAELLFNKLKQAGKDVIMCDFPNYDDGFWGKQVGRMLTGEFGPLFDINPYLAVLPYMLDEKEGSKTIIEPAINSGKIIVSNRYFTSNVHQIAKQPVDKREAYASWLWEAGYKQMELAMPDLVMVLLVDPNICKQNIVKKAQRNYAKGKAMDEAEENFYHQMEAAKEYKKMAHKEPNRWILIDCCKDDQLLSMDEISQIIWQEINKRIIL